MDRNDLYFSQAFNGYRDWVVIVKDLRKDNRQVKQLPLE